MQDGRRRTHVAGVIPAVNKKKPSPLRLGFPNLSLGGGMERVGYRGWVMALLLPQFPSLSHGKGEG